MFKHPIVQEAQDKIFPFLPKSEGNLSFKAVWELFYDTRLLKYVHQSQYRLIKPSKYGKISALKTLRSFCKAGYLRECIHPETKKLREVFIATDEVLPILELTVNNTDVLPKNESVGEGDINEVLNTEVFIQAMKRKDFHTLLYPQVFRESHDLIPDALLVLKEEKKYRLVFLEVEAKKPNWVERLEKKRDNYLLLARDQRFFEYWKDNVGKVGFSVPDITQLKFTVTFICSLQKDFGEGFKFQTSQI